MLLLRSFYRQNDSGDVMADAQRKIWLHHLRHLPNDIIEAAVLKWTGDPNPFPPAVPGDFLTLANPIYYARRHRLAVIDEMLAAPPLPKYEERLVGPGRDAARAVITQLTGPMGKATP